METPKSSIGCTVFQYTDFNEWLKLETKKAWEELIQFWEENKL
jgi:hypothetical protein